MKPPLSFKTIVAIPTILIAFCLASCEKHFTDSSFVQINEDSVYANNKVVNCPQIEIPWLYIDAEYLRNTVKNNNKKPLIFSNTIKNCQLVAEAWFLDKGAFSGEATFPDEPLVVAKPVGNGCAFGNALVLPEGTYVSDLAMKKDLLKIIKSSDEKWIILIPQFAEKHGRLFFRWSVNGSNDNPTNPCNQVGFGPYRSNGLFQNVGFRDQYSAPVLTLTRELGLANPIPPWPTDL